MFFFPIKEDVNHKKYQYNGIVKAVHESEKDFALVIETKPNNEQNLSLLFREKDKVRDLIKCIVVGDSVYLNPNKNLINVIKFTRERKRVENKFIVP